jgi:DNA-binding HxlR family transcriptional regulator
MTQGNVEPEHRAASVASEAIQLAISRGSFKGSEIQSDVSEATRTRVLRQLEQDGWLTRSVSQSSIWRAGEKAKSLGSMTPAAIEKSEQ